MRIRYEYGVPCFKEIEVRIVVPGVKTVRHRVHAKPGTWFNPQHSQHVIEQEARMLVKELPQYDFRFVPLAANRFNLIGALR